MKNVVRSTVVIATIGSSVLLAGWLPARAQAQDERAVVLTAQAQSADNNRPAAATSKAQPRISFQSAAPYAKKRPAKEVAWLGLKVEESSEDEALSSQLGLKAGEGLTVNSLAPESPAAKADFHTNDVLVELDGQMLVHPQQLRKLVQMHAVGDTIKLTFYRGGERQTASVKLGKTTSDQASDQEEGTLPSFGQNIWFQRASQIARLNPDGSLNSTFYPGVAKNKQAKEVAWLGLSFGESSEDEALSSQLGLKPGEGLTVNFIAPDSPAEKADFHTNDVLVELDGQMLVHPMQLRKLVQMRAEGDTINLTFYRGGKKQTAAVKLGKTTSDRASDREDGPLLGDLPILQYQVNRLSGQLRFVGDSLARAGLDKAKVNYEIQRTMDQTSKAIQDAVRQASSDGKTLTVVGRELKDLARDGVAVDKDATVIVRNKRNSNRTIVQSDENGTLIIEAGAKKHLTARDKDGQSLFDGDVDTLAQEEKVPTVVWEKAKPLFEQLDAPTSSKPRGEGNAGEEPKS